MDSVKLARSNIKIKAVDLVGDKYIVCYEYQWRDKNHTARWSADVTFVPTTIAPGNEEPHETTLDDIRAWVNIDVVEAREALED